MIADFLKGTVDESLKKLVQPSAVVPATLFVLLNLAFIYPTAKGGVSQAFASLDETWQAVVAGTVILALGYILLNTANMVIDALAGETWRQSGLNWWWRKRQGDKRQQLVDRIKEEEKDCQARLGLRWELATQYPSVGKIEKTLCATRLGNVLIATQHTIWSRYGLDIAAFWAPLEASKDLKDAPAIIAVKDEKSTLDLLANLVLVSTIFGVEALIFFTVREDWRAAALSLLAFVGAYVAYHVAVESAQSWGDAMQVVVDLHRGELRKGLGLREPKGIADERKLWEGARHLFLPGDTAPTPGDLFKADEPPALKVTSAAALTVEQAAVALVEGVFDDSQASPPSAAGYAAVLRSIDYSFVASRKEKTGSGGVDFTIRDPRVWRMRKPDDVRVDGVEAKATVERVGEKDELRWRISGLNSGASLPIAFRLPLWRLTFSGDAPQPKVAALGIGFELAFDAASAKKRVTVELESFAPLGKSPKLTVNGEEKLMDLVDPLSGRFESEVHKLRGHDRLWIQLPPS